MPAPRRVLRLEQSILETVGPLVAHGLADPRLRMVTVTRVQLSPDLTVARIYWSSLGSAGDKSKARHALDRARGRVQGLVAASLRTRTTPRIEFLFDDAVEEADKIDRLLQEIAREREGRQGGSGEESADTESDASSDEETSTDEEE